MKFFLLLLLTACANRPNKEYTISEVDGVPIVTLYLPTKEEHPTISLKVKGQEITLHATRLDDKRVRLSPNASALFIRTRRLAICHATDYNEKKGVIYEQTR